MPETPESERAKVLAELSRVRRAVRERALGERPPADVLGQPRPVPTPTPLPPDPPVPDEPEPQPPSNEALNRLWEGPRLEAAAGWRGQLLRLLRSVVGPALERQVAFNSAQVQFDNAMLDFVIRRLERTHRHYDAVLGIHGRHLGEVDERHLILQEELVAHVHDLVARIDLVLSEAERGRTSLELALQDVRGRLAELERRLASPGERPPSR